MKIDLKELFQLDEKFDQKSVNALLSAIKNNHIDEFDYLKFKSSVLNLMEMDMDEETGIKSTFTTAQTLGLTKNELLKTVSHYKNIIKKEKESFARALNNKLEESIVAKKEEGVKLENKIAELENKIKEYKAAIEQGQTKLSKIDDEIARVKSKIAKTKTNFVTVITQIEDVIKEDERKIQELID